MKTYFKLILIMFFIFAFPLTADAISNYPYVNVKCNVNSINVGEEFNLFVNCSSIKDLYSLSMEMKFNKNAIEIISVEPGDFFEKNEIEFNHTIEMLSSEVNLIKFYETLTGNMEGKDSNSEISLVKIKAKLLKNCKVPFEVINTKSNLFIGTPNIRIVLANSSSEKIEFSSSTSYIKTNTFLSDDEIRLFISDTYKKTFSRDAEEYGFNYWYNKLISYEYSVRAFLINLLNEKEFIEKNLSNEEFITSMYSIIANRNPDHIGYNYWLNTLIEFQNTMDPKTSKSKIILMICNEAELSQRAENMNLKF